MVGSAEKGWRKEFLWIIPVLLLALGLRLYTLGQRSLWVDEGFTYQISTHDPLTILMSIAGIDNHPPLHYLLLGAWMPLAGQSEFAIRFLSVVCGVLTVALLARLGRRLFGVVGGLSAALMLTLSPFHLWYSQEGRMYALLALMGVAAMSAFISALQDGQRRWWVAVLVLDVLALCSHYYAFFLVGAQVLVVLIVSWREHRAWRLRGAALTVVGVGLLYTPWLIAVWQQYQRDPHNYVPPLGIVDVWRNVINIFSVGEMPAPGSEWIVWALLVFVLVGVLPWSVRPGPRDESHSSRLELLGVLVCVLWLAVVVLVPYLLATVFSLDLRVGGSMYYIVALPAYCLLAGRGLVLLGRVVSLLLSRVRMVATAGSLVIMTVALVGMLVGLWSNASYQFDSRHKEDFRGAADYIMEHEWPGEQIILHAEYIWYPFAYYYHGTSQWHRASTGDAARVDTAMREMTAGSSRVWIVLSREWNNDPEGLVVAWLENNGLLVDEQWLYGVHVAAYSLGTPANYLPSDVTQFPSLPFGQFAQLTGGNSPAMVQAGTAARIELDWQPAGVTSEDYHVVLMLEDDSGQVWAQTDRIPVANDRRPSWWRSGENLTDRSMLSIPIGTPPGDYRLRLMVYPTSTGQPLPVAGGDDRPVLSTIKVERATPETTDRELSHLALGPSHQMVDDVSLLEARTSQSSVKPGESIRAEFFWQAIRAPKIDYAVVLRLIDTVGQVCAEQSVLPSCGRYRSTQWTAGEVVHDWSELRLPAELKPGDYRLEVTLADGGRQVGAAVEVGKITVTSPPRQMTRPTVRYLQSASLGDNVSLLGFDLNDQPVRPGSEVRLTLYWEALGAADASYTVFTHVLSSDGQVIAQKDNIPVGGQRPTTTWAKGEYIVDEYTINIPPGTPEGEYQVEIGMYLAANGQRLPVGADDHVVLGEMVRVADK